jgi:hypothetical protein
MRFWLTLTGQRCPNSWFIKGVNVFGIESSKHVRCIRPRRHAGKCVNEGVLHFSSARDFRQKEER